jgi:flagellar hook-associated protein 2
MASHLESVINGDSELNGRTVDVSVDGGEPPRLTITSESLGSTSEVKLQSGPAWQALGFAGDETDSGTDVEGNFIVNGVVESATGRGTLLIGDEGNAATADLQVRANINAADLTEGAEGTITVTRGLASRLDSMIDDLLDVENGQLKTINDRFTATDEGIQDSIERINIQVEAQQQSLISQFTALESIVGNLQQTGNFLSAQFSGISGLSI